MAYKHCCVINSVGEYITFVLQTSEKDMSGNDRYTIQNYELKPGEHLIEGIPPAIRTHAGSTGFLVPRWDSTTNQWKERADAKDIAAWEAEHPAPEPMPKQPTQGDINTQAIAELSIAQAQSDMVTQQALAELSILIASGGAENV